MKVALIRKAYSPFGGAERYINTLAKHLADSGHEVHVFANKWESATTNEPLAQRLVFHKVAMMKGLSVLEALTFAINARRLLEKEQFDVAFSFERTLHQDIYRAGDGCHKEWLVQRAKYEPRWKTLLVRVNPLHLVLLWIEKWLFDPKNTKKVIANSFGGKEEILKHYDFPEDRIHVVYNSVDTKRFSPLNREKYRATVRMELGVSPSDRVIFFLGSGFERKGLSFAMRMVEACNDPRAKLVVAGKDDTRKYQGLATQLGIRDKVIFVGPTEEPEKLYAAADIFLLPTIYDPFSNACLEAMASGIPVVTTRTNGASEWITEGANGYVIEQADDIDSGKSKLVKGLMLKVDRLSISDMYRLSWERQVDEVISICQQGLN